MAAHKQRLNLIIVLAYILIATIWVVVPDVLAGRQDGRGVSPGSLAWDSFFTFVSASLLFLGLRGSPPGQLAALGRLVFWLRVSAKYLPILITSSYAALALLAMTVPDLLFADMGSERLKTWLTVAWDALFVGLSSAALIYGLRRLGGDDAVVEGFGQPLRRGFAYGFAVAGALLAAAVRLSLHPAFAQHHMTMLFLIPISLSALLGGLGPGLTATGLTSACLAYLFVYTAGSTEHPAEAFLPLSLLVLNGVILSVLSELRLRVRTTLQASLQKLQTQSCELQQSDERFRALFAGSPVAMAISRQSDGKVVEVNDAFLEMFGLERKEVVGRTTLELGIWRARADRDQLLEELRARGRVSGAPVQLARADGGILYGLISFKKISFAGADYIHGVVLNVSAGYLAQKALERSEYQFRLLVEATTDYAFFWLDPEGRVLSWSLGSQGIKGYTAEEIIGRRFDCFYTEEDRADQVPQHLLEHAARTGRDEHEGWRVRRDGSRFWAKAILYAIRGEDGELLGFTKITQNLTQQKAVEQGLRDSEARYAGMIHSAMDGIINIDQQQRITLFNPAAEAMFGLTREAMLGQRLDRLLPVQHRERHGQLVEAFGRTGKTSRMMGGQGRVKVQGVRANGQVFDLEASISQLEIKGEMSFSVILRDVSERERTLAELTRQLQQLESLNDLSRAILAAHDPFQIAQVGLRHLRKLVPFWGATAMIIDWEERFAKVLAVERSPGSSYDPGQRLSLHSYGLDDLELLAKGQVCRVDDLAALPRRSVTLERLLQQGMGSYIRIPLLAENALLGVLNLASKEPGAFSAEQQDIAEAYARQLAIGLQQSLLRERVERLNRVYEVLSRINTLIARCHDLDELFKGVCRIAVEAGAYRMAWVGTIDPDSLEGSVVADCGVERDYFQKIELSARDDSPFRDRPGCRAARLGEMVVCNDVQSDASLDPLRADLEKFNVRAVCCLPITVGDRTAAVLALFAGDAGAFDKQEISLLRELGGDIAFAMEHIQNEKRLDYLAYYDSLTGLANRSLLGERLGLRMAAAERKGDRFAVVFLDIEHFKAVNDVFGRQTGDNLLRLLTARLVQYFADDSLLARIGADQFAAILPDAGNEEEAARRVEQVRQSCLGATMDAVEGSDLRLSAKLGIAMYPDDGQDAATLLEHAESALKRAKAAGERFLFYRQEMTQRAVAALALANKLRLAIEQEQFVLHYQPKVDAGSSRVVGVEALIRWQSPELGLVPPAQFIPMLEELGLIVEVGAWVLRQAARDYHAWRAAGLDAPRIAVNVSPLQLRQADFVSVLQAALALYPDDMGLELEITESQMMDDMDCNIAKLRQARELGLAIAIDDFGTGYSSLAYLARLPVQALKIDCSFVRDMQQQPEAMTLVEMIISLAHAMGLEVIAEGVESREQADVLTRLSCDVLQGFWFSMPLPADELAAYLQRERREAASLLRG
ncbi:EAL domain-containing protein [Chromobacterium sphagni]|uniref:Diguanylate cyclase n=1 Tax=Chromobacterium sphagni TaxID=1903179 RepID=A0ABX3CDT7_9NEIS|nr:EAL domain-containing protein [Chromobacterium sphagni]OHX20205.1 hypothetical protein BI344_06830 [Chromobacterium sphagni]